MTLTVKGDALKRTRTQSLGRGGAPLALTERTCCEVNHSVTRPDSRIVLGSTGWKWRSATGAASPVRRDS